MKKGFLTIIAALVLSGCSINQKNADPAEVITNNVLDGVETRYEDFPASLKTLAKDLEPKQYKEVLGNLKTDREKYTLVALAEKVAGMAKEQKAEPAQLKEFESFFVEAAKINFDWTKGIAIRGLAHTADMGQMHFLIGFLDDQNPVIVDETLVALKVVFDRQKVETTRSPASNSDEVYSIHDADYWKKWASQN